jgi:hypothetical protein
MSYVHVCPFYPPVVTGKETTNQNGGLQLAKSSNKQQLGVFPLEQAMF